MEGNRRKEPKSRRRKGEKIGKNWKIDSKYEEEIK